VTIRAAGARQSRLWRRKERLPCLVAHCRARLRARKALGAAAIVPGTRLIDREPLPRRHRSARTRAEFGLAERRGSASMPIVRQLVYRSKQSSRRADQKKAAERRHGMDANLAEEHRT